MFDLAETPAIAARAEMSVGVVADEPAAPPGSDQEDTPFLCNVCGAQNVLPRWRLTREDGHCCQCQCYGRLRSMIYALTAHFSPHEPVLAQMKSRKEIRGLGCSDWGYAGLLAEKFDYVNTFYDREPRLDLCNVDWTRWTPASFDFITCTDVLEHVAPPIEAVFANIYRLLKPGGVAILTVPTTLERATREHFPALHDWRIEGAGENRVLVNRRRDGSVEQFRNLCFHGGAGLTLEFRYFSRNGLIRSIKRAGLRIAGIYQTSNEAHAIPLCEHNIVLVARKPRTPWQSGASVLRSALRRARSAWRRLSSLSPQQAHAAGPCLPQQPSITIPLYYPDAVRRVGASRVYGVVQTMLAENDEAYARLLRELSRYTEKLFRIPLRPTDDAREPYFEDNGSFSHLDAVALYCLVAHIRPRQIIEIRSGHSTKFMRRAVSDWQLPTKIVSIDPHPRAEVGTICDQVIRSSALDVAPEFFGSLAENDFLFVDGSHLVFTGAELPWLFLEILPRLAPGVIIHFHDVFLPEDYPAARQWQDMYYNEEYCLAAFLYRNPDYRVLLPNHYLEAFRPQLITDNLDLSQAPPTDKVNFRGGASFWIQKRSGAR